MDPHSNAETFCMNPDNGDDARNRTLSWRSAWQDKDLTDRAAANVKETDAAKRIEAYESLQRDFRERSAFAILLQQVAVAGLRKGISGFQIGPLSDRTPFSNIAKT